MRFNRLTLILLITLSSLLSGCTAVVVGGVATGASVIHDRRDAETVLRDKETLLKAMQLRHEDAELKEQSNISIDVYNKRILLTGQTHDPALVQRYAEQLAQFPGVTKIFNEVVVNKEATWSDTTQDVFLTSKVKLALFNIKLEGFDPTRVKVVSSLNSVYLLGLVSAEEADAVTEEVRYIRGVKRVVRLFEYL